MTLQQAIEHFGSVGAIAAALNISSAAVSQWRARGIPEPRQFQIEVLSDGALRADRPVSGRSQLQAA